MSENHFAKALHNFTMDAAAGDAIRHLTDKGFTLPQIRETLTFPAPEEYIAQVMWERMLETGKVRIGDGSGFSKEFDCKISKKNTPFENPEPSPILTSTEFVETYDRYGRKSFLRVNKKSSEDVIFSPEDYVQYEDMWVLTNALEQVSSLSGHIPLKDRSTGSHRDK